jgi:hypothetical protein
LRTACDLLCAVIIIVNCTTHGKTIV